MPRFRSYDSTELAYTVSGVGPPLVVVPGGPLWAAAYLGDLGGLGHHRTLIMLDHRGCGGSAVPQDPGSYRCDRIVDDVEAFRAHLGLDRMDLLTHSAGGNVAELYAARFPDRVRRMVLVAPGLRSVGIEAVGFTEAVEARAGEWWYPAAKAALDGWLEATGRGAGPEELAPLRAAAAPFFHGRWDERARLRVAAEDEQRGAGADHFYTGFAPDTGAVRDALGDLKAAVLVVAGAVDPAPTPAAARLLAEVFGHAEVTVQAGAGHSPWQDDPVTFTRTVREFLDRPEM
ncbi:MAG TPA: alpha/beta hydrolase [Micromonospora sp.]